MTPSLTIYKLIRRLQQRNRYVATASGSSLSLVESQLLLEIDADPEQSISGLTELFNLEQSSISRAVQGLCKKGMLKSTPSAEDARRRCLKVTTHGAKTLSNIDKHANEIIELLMISLTPREQEQLQSFLSELLIAMGAPETRKRKNDLSMRVLNRRLARTFGVLGESAFDSGLVSTHFQILSEVALLPEGVTSGLLAETLSLPANTLAAAIAALKKRALIKVLTSLTSPEKRIQITSPGSTLLRDTELRISTRIRTALSSSNQARINKGIELLSRYVDGLEKGTIPISVGMYLRPMRQMEAQKARTFLIEQCVAQKNHTALPAQLCGSENECYLLCHHQEIVAIIQFHHTSKELHLDAAAREPKSCPYPLFRKALTAAEIAMHSKTTLAAEITFPI